MGYWPRLSVSHPVEGLADFTEATGVISTLIAWQAEWGTGIELITMRAAIY